MKIETQNSESENMVTLQLDATGWKIWFAYYQRLGLTPPSYGQTVTLTRAAARYIFDTHLLKMECLAK